MGEASGEVGFTSRLKELRFLNCRDRYEPILAAALTAFPHLGKLQRPNPKTLIVG
jgi:hypothetical protein